MEKPDVERMLNDLEKVFSDNPDMGFSTAALCISVPPEGRDVETDLERIMSCLAGYLLKESARQYIDRHAGLVESLVAAYDRASGDRFSQDLCLHLTPRIPEVTEPWRLESLTELVRDTFTRPGLRRPVTTGAAVSDFAKAVTIRREAVDPGMTIPRIERMLQELTYLSARSHRWTD